MQPSTGDITQVEADETVVGLQGDALEPIEDPGLVHSSRRSRIVVAEHVPSAIRAYPTP